VWNSLKILAPKAAFPFLILLFFFLLLEMAGSEEIPVTPSFQPSFALKIQIELDQKGYSPGEIDATLGQNTKKAISVFQKFHSLKPTGLPDPETLKDLLDDTPVVMYYIVDEDDVAGPFTPKIPRDLLEQTKLPSLEYTSPMELLSEKFHVNPAVLQIRMAIFSCMLRSHLE
jgi:hypothetical protein